MQFPHIIKKINWNVWKILARQNRLVLSKAISQESLYAAYYKNVPIQVFQKRLSFGKNSVKTWKTQSRARKCQISDAQSRQSGRRLRTVRTRRNRLLADPYKPALTQNPAGNREKGATAGSPPPPTARAQEAHLASAAVRFYGIINRRHWFPRQPGPHLLTVRASHNLAPRAALTTHILSSGLIIFYNRIFITTMQASNHIRGAVPFVRIRSTLSTWLSPAS